MKLFKKIILSILCVLALLIISAVIFENVVTSQNNAYKGDYKSILTINETNAKKALVVYQPGKSADCKEIADKIAKGLHEAGFEVTLTYPGKHLSQDVQSYSVLVFGSPTYFAHTSKQINRSVSNMTGFSDQKVVLYALGNLNESPELDILEKLLNDKLAYKKLKFITDVKENNQTAYYLGKNIEKE